MSILLYSFFNNDLMKFCKKNDSIFYKTIYRYKLYLLKLKLIFIYIYIYIYIYV